MERKYRAACIGGSPEQIIADSKVRTVCMYLLILFLVLCLSAAAVSNLARGGLSEIDRAEYGGDARTVEAEVEAAYGDERVKREVRVKVLPKEAEPEIVAQQMASLKERLPKLILGENESLNGVVSDLILPSFDEETGIDLAWESDKAYAVSEEGRVNLIDGAAGEDVILTARLRKGDAQDEVAFRVIVGDPGADYDYAKNLGESLEAAVKNIGEDTTGDRLILPTSTNSGVKLDWKVPGDLGMLAFVFVLIFVGFAVYRNRYALVDRTVDRWRDGVKRDFPGFLNKLLLLLNAGLVITGAIAKIAEDYEERRRAGEERHFYEELLGIRDRMQASNTTLASEFTDMAIRSDRREIMRFSAILADNIDKGNALAEKLSQESQILWRGRKKDAEEKGRLAETKLTFPMVLQLLAIILITVAPAVMNMR
jgi:hypothetical protein